MGKKKPQPAQQQDNNVERDDHKDQQGRSNKGKRGSRRAAVGAPDDGQVFEIVHDDVAINGRTYIADSHETAAKKALRDFKAMDHVTMYCFETDTSQSFYAEDLKLSKAMKQRDKARRADRVYKRDHFMDCGEDDSGY